ncbi:MAG TPA: dihydrolipoamide acetyltransferase family protein [Marmoricola sp.]|nr:dihydrolipoamide acetyltransferase family protein [Marmoricola sp.]
MSDFTMPSLGADMVEGTLLEWLVKPGDTVHRGDIVAVVDTAKAAVEIETFSDGVVRELLVEPGTVVPVGGTMAVFGPVGAAAPTEPVPTPAAQPATRHAKKRAAGPPRKRAAKPAMKPAAARSARHPSTTTTASAPAPVASAAPLRIRATPHARRVAAELGVDIQALAQPGGPPVRAQDVLAAAAATHPPATVTEPAARASVDEPVAPATSEPAPSRQVSGTDAMRQAIARLMSRSKREIPHYYLSTTVDLSRALDWLHERNRALAVGDRLVPAALLLKATALAAEATPAMNGFWVDDAFQAAPRVHLGVAVSLRGGGLVAPALHDAAHLDLVELMARMRDLVTRARAGRLRGSELSDPTITVTNLGEQGVEAVHGVIYPPQVALVGFGRISERPWAVDGMLGVRPLTTLTLAGDHRATDGFTGARFLADIEQHLQQPEEL